MADQFQPDGVSASDRASARLTAADARNRREPAAAPVHGSVLRPGRLQEMEVTIAACQDLLHSALEAESPAHARALTKAAHKILERLEV